MSDIFAEISFKKTSASGFLKIEKTTWLEHVSNFFDKVGSEKQQIPRMTWLKSHPIAEENAPPGSSNFLYGLGVSCIS